MFSLLAAVIIDRPCQDDRSEHDEKDGEDIRCACNVDCHDCLRHLALHALLLHCMRFFCHVCDLLHLYKGLASPFGHILPRHNTCVRHTSVLCYDLLRPRRPRWPRAIQFLFGPVEIGLHILSRLINGSGVRRVYGGDDRLGRPPFVLGPRNRHFGRFLGGPILRDIADGTRTLSTIILLAWLTLSICEELNASLLVLPSRLQQRRASQTTPATVASGAVIPNASIVPWRYRRAAQGSSIEHARACDCCGKPTGGAQESALPEHQKKRARRTTKQAIKYRFTGSAARLRRFQYRYRLSSPGTTRKP
mmetsp:Transcript_17977/g.38361  ORF Transcript_17977/g.38361 Transcript_17977/m.38361 type:complete len:306 (-) Transcript_17977:14-931(-)